MARIHVKIYGERNTGTNYLARLVRLNFDAAVLTNTVPLWWRKLFGRSNRSRDRYFAVMDRLNLGWKHGLARTPQELRRIYPFAGRLLVLSLTKNPYSWLLSLHRRPYHSVREPGELETFLQTPWPTVGRENHPEPFANPIEMWNRKNASYLALHRGVSAVRGRCLRYEDLILDPEAVLGDIAERFSVPHRSTFQNLEQSTKAESEKKDFAWYRDYYAEERWRSDLSPRAVEIVNAHVDRELMKELGYGLLAPVDFG